jgi:hypothetical protein
LPSPSVISAAYYDEKRHDVQNATSYRAITIFKRRAGYNSSLTVYHMRFLECTAHRSSGPVAFAGRRLCNLHRLKVYFAPGTCEKISLVQKQRHSEYLV